jgi:hypothetical protein
VDAHAVERGRRRFGIDRDQDDRAQHRNQRQPMRDRALSRLQKQVYQQDRADCAEQESLGQKQDDIVNVE